MTKRILVLVGVLVTAVTIFNSVLRAQIQWTVRDGVYTETQAIRGEELVNSYACANCHGGGLGGGREDVPPLVGPDFTGLWDGRPLGDLHRMVSDMPPSGSRKLNTQGRVDVLAYILWLNYYPTGPDELPPDKQTLDRIKIVLP